MLTFILFLFTGKFDRLDKEIKLLIFFYSGTIGFLACFWFVRIIYSTIRMDSMADVAIIDVSV
jgi:hypothetical protein